MPEGKDKIKIKLNRMLKSMFLKNYFIALCASIWYISSVVYLKNEIQGVDFTIALFLFFSTALMYNLDRIFGDEWPLVKSFYRAITNKDAAFQKNHNKIFNQIIFALPTILLFFLIPANVKLSLFIPAFVAFVYAFPLGKYQVRLRELPYAKIFSIALVWAWIGSFLAVKEIAEVHVLIFVERFLLIYAITIPFDLRDIKPDEEKNISTIPVKIGIQKSLSSAVIALLFMLTLIWIFEDGYGRLLVGILAIITILLWKKERTWVYYLLIIDGFIVLDSIAILLHL